MNKMPTLQRISRADENKQDVDLNYLLAEEQSLVSLLVFFPGLAATT
jgi:uncharacterized membrane protein YciS (DUF1049 family)